MNALNGVEAASRERETQVRRLAEQVARLERELEGERSARLRAERSDMLKDQFLAMVAHELRSPLGAVLGWAHMLRRRGSEEEFERGLDVIEQSVAVQVKLVDDLLDMSRIVSGKVRLDPEVLEARVFVEAALEAMRPAAAAKGVQMREVLDAAAPPVRGDRTRLQQILTNLLSNAIKFTPQGGLVEVRLQAADGGVAVSVSDTGVGIAAEFLPHVFERFKQDAGALQANAGLGLGLAIARHLVLLHGGTITASSDGPGQGAVFTLKLPAA